MVYGYTRVSTDKQITSTQRSVINSYCKKNNLSVDKWFDETISGAKDLKERKFGVLIKKAVRGDIIVVTEVSRIGRSMGIIAKVMFDCIDKGVIIHCIKENMILSDDNPQTKLLMEVFSFAAELERNLIRQRTIEGLAERKRMGVMLGRPVGAKNKHYVLDDKQTLIKTLLIQGISKQRIARRCGVNKSTLYSYLYKYMPETACCYIDRNKRI